MPIAQSNLAEEERRVRYLARLADVICAFISQGNLSVVESCRMLQIAREEALRLFPDKGAVYELVYQPRFTRLVTQHALSSMEWMN
jgi:hypothetical protein